MANYVEHGLKENKSYFELRGIVNGVQKKGFFREGFGTNKNGVSVNFGVEFNKGKTAYVTLTGYPRKTVNYYKKGENGAKGTNKQIPWAKRHESPGEGFNLIGIRLSTGKDEEGNNINKTFIEYDAVNWLHANLKDGDNVFIKGHIEWSSYEKDGQVYRNVNLIPEQISYTKKPINFEAEDFEEKNRFENTLIFNSIDKEINEKDKATGRFILTGYYINYRGVENTSFIIEEENTTLANNLKKVMKPGYAISTYGTVKVSSKTEVVEEDDGWGNGSTFKKFNGPVIREYVVDKAEKTTLDKETWSEKEIAEAIKKMKAAKKATENFGDPIVEDDVDAWDDDDNEDAPWE